MTKYKDQEKPLMDCIDMINMIALRYQAGQDWPWVKGMLKHHLPLLTAKTHTSDRRTIVKTYLKQITIDMIQRFMFEVCKTSMPTQTEMVCFQGMIEIYPILSLTQ